MMKAYVYLLEKSKALRRRGEIESALKIEFALDLLYFELSTVEKAYIQQKELDRRFIIVMNNSFYAFELYNEKGEHIYELKEALQEADRQYGEAWKELYNGSAGVIREELTKNEFGEYNL